MPAFCILNPGAAAPYMQEPIAGHWYFGMNADGTTGMLAEWDGWAFRSSVTEGDEADMSRYAYLHECIPRR